MAAKTVVMQTPDDSRNRQQPAQTFTLSDQFCTQVSEDGLALFSWTNVQLDPNAGRRVVCRKRLIARLSILSWVLGRRDQHFVSSQFVAILK
jgi:hypothetical protein